MKKNWTLIATCHSLSDLDKTYPIKIDEDGHYGCTCPSWIFKHQSDADGNRTCKHIEAYKRLGVDARLVEWSGGKLMAEGTEFGFKVIDKGESK